MVVIAKDRVRLLNSAPVRQPARYVLYWSQMNRRAVQNHALVYAAEQANALDLPLLVYEGLTCTYRQANDRMHTFVLEGVPEQRRRITALGAGYAFYLRRKRSDANDILYRLAREAALVVTDDYPVFIAAGHNASVPDKIGIPYYAVDASCVVPMRRFDRREWAAYTLRPKIHKLLPDYLHPLEPVKLRRKWTGEAFDWDTSVTDASISGLVASCEIDHSVKPSTRYKGGALHAEARLKDFLDHSLQRYPSERNEPSRHATSELSPYLHFGQISALEMALSAAGYSEAHGFGAAEFLEELIVRRELAFNFALHCPNPDSLECLPDWARKTLGEHDRDEREAVYTQKQFECGETHDALWNAAQKELLLRGKIHGYYRMYWAKKIIEWSPSHQSAQDLLLYLHDRYALDGRDPNTYTNVLWCFGLHDRPWSERPIFGRIRYMSLDGMKRKTDVPSYIKEIDHLERTGKELC
jgi:deoxyribodipyrimidine photo-lyase